MIKSKRVALSLKPDIDSVLTDLAKLTKQTKTSIINGILKEMQPMLKQTVLALEKAQKGNTELAISLMKDLFNDTEQKFKDAGAQIELDGLGATNGNK